MKVNLAAQPLYCEGKLKLSQFQGCGPTVQCIRVFDHLFDVLNSRNPLARNFKVPIRRSNYQYTRRFLYEASEYIQNLKGPDGQSMASEEVGQLIRRIWVNISTNQIAPFSSCSHEAFGIENLHKAHKYRIFSCCYAHFFGNFTRYYFYNSQSTHWNGILKGKHYFPVYFDLSLLALCHCNVI